ncbi:MAG TPA: hypothetical protein VFW94_08720 [Candidatus Acidoferrales bacterium]|nr:hypothetical protein [Candidatus Acidoferrales bacterium]
MQYHWINQLAKAQRQRTRADLSAALSNVETDFDVEITRTFLAVQVPFPNITYADRYEEWLHYAPYPKLLKGIYILDGGDAIPKPVVTREPAIGRIEWPADFKRMPPQFGEVTASVALPMGLQVFSTSGGMGALVSAGPDITVDGIQRLRFRRRFLGHVSQAE